MGDINQLNHGSEQIRNFWHHDLSMPLGFPRHSRRIVSKSNHALGRIHHPPIRPHALFPHNTVTLIDNGKTRQSLQSQLY
jgi:hypothetical protein